MSIINLDGILHNVIMIKCQMWPLGYAAWLVQEVRQWPPFSFGGIILASDRNRLIDDGQISNSNGSSPWVTINLGICSNLMHIRQS